MNNACILSLPPKSNLTKCPCSFSHLDWFLECVSAGFCHEGTCVTFPKVLWCHLSHLTTYVLPWDGSEVNRTLFTLQVYRISPLAQLHQSYQFSLLLKSRGRSKEATEGEVPDTTKYNAFLKTSRMGNVFYNDT